MALPDDDRDRNLFSVTADDDRRVVIFSDEDDTSIDHEFADSNDWLSAI